MPEKEKAFLAFSTKKPDGTRDVVAVVEVDPQTAEGALLEESTILGPGEQVTLKVFTSNTSETLQQRQA